MLFRVVIPEITFQPSGNPISEDFLIKQEDISDHRKLREKAFGALGAAGLHNFTRWGEIDNRIKTVYGTNKIRTVRFSIFDENNFAIYNGEVTFDVNGSILTIP